MTGSDSDRSENGEDTDNELPGLVDIAESSSSDAGSDDEHERNWESTSSDEEGSDDDEFERHSRIPACGVRIPACGVRISACRAKTHERRNL